jgi:hypothetical protein
MSYYTSDPVADASRYADDCEAEHRAFLQGLVAADTSIFWDTAQTSEKGTCHDVDLCVDGDTEKAADLLFAEIRKHFSREATIQLFAERAELLDESLENNVFGFPCPQIVTADSLEFVFEDFCQALQLKIEKAIMGVE